MENNDWINDVALEQDLRDCVRRRNLKRKEILGFMKRDYEQYCTATLNRRLHFYINYIHHETSLETVQAAAQKELNGPGKLLGDRALNQKLIMQHEVQVPQNVLHKMTL